MGIVETLRDRAKAFQAESQIIGERKRGEESRRREAAYLNTVLSAEEKLFNHAQGLPVVRGRLGFRAREARILLGTLQYLASSAGRNQLQEIDDLRKRFRLELDGVEGRYSYWETMLDREDISSAAINIGYKRQMEFNVQAEQIRVRASRELVNE